MGPTWGREALIREIPGALIPVFVMGWLSTLMAPLLNTASLFGNPHGIYSKGWVNAKSLNTFQTMFIDAINKSPSALQAREVFIRNVLTQLTASDENTLKTTLAALKKQGNTQLANQLEKAYTGRMAKNQLSQEAIEHLVNTFRHQASPQQGMVAIDEQLAKFSQSSAVKGLEGKALTKALNQKRLELSKSAATHFEQLAETRLEKAVSGGLTDRVHLGKHARNQPLSMVLRDLHYFLEQYADRAMAHPTSGNIARGTFNKADVLNKLFKSPSRGFLARWHPSLQDGLVSYAVKSKRLLVLAPLVITSALGFSVAFINNEITRRKLKNGGFPGEMVFHETEKLAASGKASASSSTNLNPKNVFGALLNPNVDHITLPNAGLANQAPGVRFGNAAGVSAIPGWLNALDYQSLGSSLLMHSFLIYTVQNVGRAIAAGHRSFNEVREAVTRDSLGAFFWFFAGGLTQMGVVNFMAPKVAIDLLLVKNTKPAGKLQQMLWKWIPSQTFSFATSKQMKHRATQMETALAKSGMKGNALTTAKESIENVLLHGGRKWRSLANGVGIVNTILLLGIGIPLYNIYLTRHNVSQGKVGKW